MDEVPPGEYLPAGQGFTVPVAWPATQKYPAGHAFCTVLACVESAQKKPALQGFAVALALAVPRQKPAPQAPQEDSDTDALPPAEKVPGPHASDALSAAPPGKVVGNVTAGQKKPAGHGTLVVKVGQ